MIFKDVKNANEIKSRIKSSKNKEEKPKDDENAQILNIKRKRTKKHGNDKSINNGFEKENAKNILIDPININDYHDLTYDAHSYFSFDNTFCVFNSVDNIPCLIYSNKYSIISFNLKDNTKINEIKGASNDEYYITNLRHHSDIKNKRDLLISITAWGNNFKLWNIINMECLCYIKSVNSNGYLYSACFLNDDNEIYVLTSNYNKNFYIDDSEPVKIYNLDGLNISTLNNSYISTFFIDVYFDNNSKKNFVITGNKNAVRSYDFKENKLYHQYSHKDCAQYDFHYCCTVNNLVKNVQLIETSSHGIIRLWNFHSGKLIKKIEINKNYKLFGISLWDDNHVFVGSEDNSIKLVNLKNRAVINNLDCHNNYVLTVKKILHPIYGQCLISQGYSNDQIKLITNIN